MGTEVLRPRDITFRVHHPTTSFQRRRNLPAKENLTNLIVNKRPTNNYGHNKKTSPKPEKKRVSDGKKTQDPSRIRPVTIGGLEMGQVTLLKRGEALGSCTPKLLKSVNPSPKAVKSPNKVEALDSVTSKLLKSVNTSQKAVKSPNKKVVDDMVVCGSGRIGPDLPEMVPKQIRVVGTAKLDMYAGSGYYMSPSPRSLPLPSFFSKQRNSGCENLATKDLRRWLNLD